jgi:hypothetical protein
VAFRGTVPPYQPVARRAIEPDPRTLALSLRRTAQICPRLDFTDAIGIAPRLTKSRSFDKDSDFVLDSRKISPIIYIWYEGGWLSPPVVTAEWSVGGWVANPEEKTMAKKAAKGAKKKAAKKR